MSPELVPIKANFFFHDEKVRWSYIFRKAFEPKLSLRTPVKWKPTGASKILVIFKLVCLTYGAIFNLTEHFLIKFPYWLFPNLTHLHHFTFRQKRSEQTQGQRKKAQRLKKAPKEEASRFDLTQESERDPQSKEVGQVSTPEIFSFSPAGDTTWFVFKNSPRFPDISQDLLLFLTTNTENL